MVKNPNDWRTEFFCEHLMPRPGENSEMGRYPHRWFHLRPIFRTSSSVRVFARSDEGSGINSQTLQLTPAYAEKTQGTFFGPAINFVMPTAANTVWKSSRSINRGRCVRKQSKKQSFKKNKITRNKETISMRKLTIYFAVLLMSLTSATAFAQNESIPVELIKVPEGFKG